MIVVRNVFRLKFGKAREALSIIKDGVAIQKRAGMDFPTRLLTDVTGRFYTIVVEITAPSLAAFETAVPRFLGDKDWLSAWNENPKPFVWTATVDSILAKLARCRQTLEQIQPGCTVPKTRKRKSS